MAYIEQDFIDAIKFILNYPTEVEYIGYDEDKDLFMVNILDDGWYMNFGVWGATVRKALKWENKTLCGGVAEIRHRHMT